MAEKIFGLTRAGIHRTAETNRRVLEVRPESGRRTRRVYPPGGGTTSATGAVIIEFQILEVDCLEKTAIGLVLARTCGVSSPDLGDEVDLIDLVGCLLDGNETLLIGRRGFATNMETEDVADPYTDCHWVITFLCDSQFTC